MSSGEVQASIDEAVERRVVGTLEAELPGILEQSMRELVARLTAEEDEDRPDILEELLAEDDERDAPRGREDEEDDLDPEPEPRRPQSDLWVVQSAGHRSGLNFHRGACVFEAQDIAKMERLVGPLDMVTTWLVRARSIDELAPEHALSNAWADIMRHPSMQGTPSRPTPILVICARMIPDHPEWSCEPKDGVGTPDNWRRVAGSTALRDHYRALWRTINRLWEERYFGGLICRGPWEANGNWYAHSADPAYRDEYLTLMEMQHEAMGAELKGKDWLLSWDMAQTGKYDGNVMELMPPRDMCPVWGPSGHAHTDKDLSQWMRRAKRRQHGGPAGLASWMDEAARHGVPLGVLEYGVNGVDDPEYVRAVRMIAERGVELYGPPGSAGTLYGDCMFAMAEGDVTKFRLAREVYRQLWRQPL